MVIEAHAKINWTLAVNGVRADGYHLLSMWMQSVTLSDRLTIEPAPALSLQVTGQRDLSDGPDNLVLRAAEALRKASGCRAGAKITLEKRIPSQAGLGGGSADAAAALYALNILWETGLPEETLAGIGLTLGADVPFCLRGGLCLAEGIGEKLKPWPRAPRWPLIVIQPCGGLSTGAVFRAWHQAGEQPERRTEAFLHAVEEDDPRLLPARPGNDLEAVSMSFAPEIRTCISALRDAGAVCAQMSGSGSAVFGVWPEAEAADEALQRLLPRYPDAVRCETCDTPFRVL